MITWIAVKKNIYIITKVTVKPVAIIFFSLKTKIKELHMKKSLNVPFKIETFRICGRCSI